MMIDITYACSMGCTHCISDCRHDGEHMSLDVFKDALSFIDQHQIPHISISGGEPFEHPQIKEILGMIADFEKNRFLNGDRILPVTICTNGRRLSTDKEMQDAIGDLRQATGKKRLLIQVTDDSRFYLYGLTEKQKYALRKIGAIIDHVPGNPENMTQCLYPQGRALKNFSEEWWYTKAPKCTNVRLIVLQCPGITMEDLIMMLFKANKFCVPVIAPDGSIKIGESALCPPVASIYDDEDTIMRKIRCFQCHGCPIPEQLMNDTVPEAAKILENAVNVWDLPLSNRVRNAFKRADIRTIGELLTYTEDDLMNIRNFGKTSLSEVRQYLEQKGLELAKQPKRKLAGNGGTL